jgi:hypothetical protein
MARGRPEGAESRRGRRQRAIAPTRKRSGCHPIADPAEPIRHPVVPDTRSAGADSESRASRSRIRSAGSAIGYLPIGYQVHPDPGSAPPDRLSSTSRSAIGCIPMLDRLRPIGHRQGPHRSPPSYPIRQRGRRLVQPPSQLVPHPSQRVQPPGQLVQPPGQLVQVSKKASLSAASQSQLDRPVSQLELRKSGLRRATETNRTKHARTYNGRTKQGFVAEYDPLHRARLRLVTRQLLSAVLSRQRATPTRGNQP